MKSWLYILLLGISVLLFCLHCARPPVAKSLPNILFIMSDDHTSQAWGVYGSILDSFAHTPNIRALASEGAILENAFCSNSICVPSRASILTGQYSHKNQVYTLSDSLDPIAPNIAKSLQEAGYRTGLFGKWHLKSMPSGFDEFTVLPGQGRYHNPVLRDAINWDSGGEQYQGFSADIITDLSLEWLDRYPRDRPFFLMTHFKATHEPFDYPERLEGLYDNVEFPEPHSLYDFSPTTNGRSFIGQKLWILGNRWIEASAQSENQRYPGLPFSLDGLDSVQQRKKIYQKFVRDFLRSGAAIDENIGRLMRYLEANNLTENTVVIYTSDQGYFLGEHGMFDKRMMYEQALRMPFVIRFPNEIPPGVRNQDIILNSDFAALFADYAGIKKPNYISGQSFRKNLIAEKTPNWRSDMYYRYWLHREERPAHFGIRTDRYKLVFFYGQPLQASGAMQTPTAPAWEFYDLQVDPQEDYNAYHASRYQEIIVELKQRLLQLRKDHADQDENSEIMQTIFNQYWQ